VVLAWKYKHILINLIKLLHGILIETNQNIFI
jgi:hypothetical protein